MPKAKLSDSIIANAVPVEGKRELDIWDTEVTGLRCRVYPTGKRVFWLQYRNAAGQTRKLRLGRYGALTVAQVRRHARILHGRILAGEDPAADKQTGRKAPTFAEFSKVYLDNFATPKKKPGGVESDRRYLEKYLLPTFGTKKLGAISTADVVRFHAGMHAAPIQANRLLSLLSAMMNKAEFLDYRSKFSNPCRGVERYKENKRERYLSEAELARLGDALRARDERDPDHPDRTAVLRLLILTGCRRGEIEKLQWAEVDLEAAKLRLIDSKTGPKEVWLPAPAVIILDRQALTESPYVFPGVAGKPWLLAKCWEWVRKRAAIEDVRIHDLRHSFASVGVSAAGLSMPVIGKLLGHSNVQTTQRYAHLSDDPMRKGVEAIGSRVHAALEGKPPAEVTPIDHRRTT
jgi:integrase